MNRRDLNRIRPPSSFARLLMVRKATEDTTPITAPMKMNHATARIMLFRLQVRQPLPDTSGGGWVLGVLGVLPGELPGVLPAFSTCIITVWVLVHDGLMLSVAVKLTMNVSPDWLRFGVNEKEPVVGSKAMFEASPVADRVTVPPEPVGSLAVTAKSRVAPTVVFRGPGAIMTGRTFVATTVMMVSAWVDEKPSVTMKLML